jgi:hypothetical protein
MWKSKRFTEAVFHSSIKKIHYVEVTGIFFLSSYCFLREKERERRERRERKRKKRREKEREHTQERTTRNEIEKTQMRELFIYIFK